MVFIKQVHDPQRFGVAEVDWGKSKILGIEEKPTKPKSRYCVTGLYVYDHRVFEIIKNLSPSARGELEITDVNNQYIEWGCMEFQEINGPWIDAGTIESLYEATCQIRNYRTWKKQAQEEKGLLKVEL